MTSNPLDTLVELAREARDKAGQLLAGERGNQQQLVTQLEVLGQYRQEYAQRLHTIMDEGIELGTLQNYQNFLASLDTAIGKARQSLADQQGKVLKCQQQWRQQQHKLSSYDTLASRREALWQRQSQRQEMRQQDEISNNLYLRERRQQASSDQD